MSDDSGKPVPLSLMERCIGAAVVVIVWATVICAALSMGRCTFDLVVGDKQWSGRPTREGGGFFVERGRP
jgi:hypothetical protein